MKKSAILLVVLSGMISISFNPFQRSNASGNQAASKNPRVELARMGDQAAIHAARRGNPYISLMDGRDLLAPVNGSPDAARLLSRNEAQPLSLASGDFDADGVADLLCGYAGAGKGVLTLYRGNVDALHPNSPGAMKRRAAKLYTDAPFLAPGLAFELPQAPDFLVAGDFDGDGKCDALAAARGSNLLHLLPGAGHGRLETAKAIDAGGRVTALVSGEINRADRIADVVVGIVSADGPKALIFEGPQGAMKAAPEIIRLPAEATSFALGHFDNDYMLDLAAAAGNELLVAHGRDRKLYLNGASRKGDEQARMSRRQFPAPIRALAAGDFSGGGRPDLALLTDDGVVRLLTKGAEGKERIERWKDKTWTRIGYSPAAQLVRSWVSSEPVDSLVIVDPARPQLRIIAGTEATERTGKADQSDAALETVGEPVAVLPMRLNVDALSDLVVLRKGSAAPVVLPTAPLDTFFVLSTADSGPGSLRDAIEQANVLSGPHEIVFAIGSVAQRASDGGLNLIRPAAETLDLQSPLPAITESVTIDGTTQSGYAGSPVIELNGANAGSDANGLTIDAGNSVVKGLAINRFSLNGISQSFADNCIFTGNFIGTDTTGTTNLGNGQSGIAVSLSDLTQIGGPLADERNLLSGNGSHGVRLEFVDNGSVVNNRIGTDVTGALDLGNGETGVLIIESSDNIISNNFISGNADSGVQIGPSIEVSSSNNIIQGNFIGTQADGTSPLGNGAQGILFHAAANNNAVGGAVTGAGNTIAFNGAGGVVVDGGSARNNILRNSIFSNTGLGIDLDSNAGGGGNGVTPNDPTDPDTGGNGLQNFPALTSAVTTGGNTTITGTFNSSTSGGFTFEFFSSPACDSSGNGEGQTFIGSTSVTTDGFGDAFINVAFPVAVPAGNVITATATSSLGDTSEFSNCVTVLTPSSTFVVNVTTDDSDIMPGDGFCSDEGGNCSLRAAIEEANASPDANTIHFNIGGGGAQTITVGTLLPPITAPVVIDGTTQPGFSGLPLIRLDGSGSVIPTATSGSRLEVAAIGSGLAIEAGGCTVRGLIITQFPGAGISLSTGGNNVVRGNFIGTDADGSANLGNRSAGVFIDNSPDNLIGGATAQDRNVISGNDFTGVTVFGEGATGNQIQGNFIGTNPAATAAVPNSLSGVRLDVTNGNTVGGTAPGAGNVISGNRGDGILLTMGATGNQIQGNFIGTQADGASPLGNTGDGIRTQDFASNNSIGVAGIAARNVIAFNQGAGANIGSGDGNTILFNSIFANAGLGIDLGGDGITPNDALDEDSGANTQLNFPVLTSAISTGGSTSVSGTFN
ncbi:MAG TPA: right-handed parallel beta-helix repeat-containing protein, partial [Blastocatellia bacterium]|nr:right-handed parallel beta-helix repeat-containing protein [Blastocatellia bacterium]